MGRLLSTLTILICACVSSFGGEKSSLTLYVQVIRGTNSEKPQDPAWKPVGQKLSKRLSPVFRWKSYWEVGLHEVAVEKGKPNKVRLNDLRRLEIEKIQDNQLEFRLYRKDQLTRKSKHNVKSLDMAIIGGSGDDDSCWFVVVRREPPQSRTRE